MGMNMLIGTLVEVVGAVSAAEREGRQVAAVKEQLQLFLEEGDSDHSGLISMEEFVKVMSDPEASKSLVHAEIDVVGLLEVKDLIFKNQGHIESTELLDVLLQFRSNNVTKVRDLTELRRFLHHDFQHLAALVQKHLSPTSGALDQGVRAGRHQRLPPMSSLQEY